MHYFLFLENLVDCPSFSAIENLSQGRIELQGIMAWDPWVKGDYRPVVETSFFVAHKLHPTLRCNIVYLLSSSRRTNDIMRKSTCGGAWQCSEPSKVHVALGTIS